MSHGCAEVVLLFKCLKVCEMEDAMKERTWTETLRGFQGRRGWINVERNSNKGHFTLLVIEEVQGVFFLPWILPGLSFCTPGAVSHSSALYLVTGRYPRPERTGPGEAD